MRLQESLRIIKDKWIGSSSRQKISVASLVFIMLALPLSVGAVLTKQYLGSRASIPVTPPITPPTALPTPMIVYNSPIIDTFNGNGPIDTTKWSWSGSIGSSAILENDQIKLSVLAGYDNVGGHNIVVLPLTISNLKITGDFDVSVDFTGIDTEAGWQELKFSSLGSISVRRNKVGSTETLEVWTSPDNTFSSQVKNVSRNLPIENNPLKIKLVRKDNEILVYYFEQNTFINILDMEYAPLMGDGSFPQLVVGNGGPNYPVTTGYFDNYFAYAYIQTAVTPPPAPTATPIAPSPTARPISKWCDVCDGITGTTCNGAFVCKHLSNNPDQGGFCVYPDEEVTVCGMTQEPTTTPTVTPKVTSKPTPTPTPICRFRIFGRCLIWDKPTPTPSPKITPKPTSTSYPTATPTIDTPTPVVIPTPEPTVPPVCRFSFFGRCLIWR